MINVPSSMQKEMPDATAVEWTKMSLVCPLSHLKIAEPVNLPDCDETFDRLSVMEKVKGRMSLRILPEHFMCLLDVNLYQQNNLPRSG